MSQASRALAYAFETGALAEQRAFILRAEDLPLKDVAAEQSFRPEFLRLQNKGWEVVSRLETGGFPLGLVLLTKHKEENFANIARGWALLADGGTLACAGDNHSCARVAADNVLRPRRRPADGIVVSSSIDLHAYGVRDRSGAAGVRTDVVAGH